MGGSAPDMGLGITLDSISNVYTTGFFTGTADFNPGAGTNNLTATGGEDVFIQKMDSSGNFQWSRSFGSAGNDEGHSIAVDRAGYVYVTGFFSGTVDFDPSPALFNLTASGSDDIFIVKLNPSGNFVWAKRMGGANIDVGNCVIIDENFRLVLCGSFMATTDFDPGVGVQNLTSAGNKDIFIEQMDSSGNFLWVRKIGGTGIDIGYAAAFMQSGSLVCTGLFSGTVDFDPGLGVSNRVSAGSTDIFIFRTDPGGNFIWANCYGSTLEDQGNSLAIDPNGNIHSTGFYMGTVDFDPGVGILNLPTIGGNVVFLHKSDSMGNVLWAKQAGRGPGTTFWNNAVGLDIQGNVYKAGYFLGTVDFDPGPGVRSFTSSAADIVVEKFDSSGNFLWAGQFQALSNNERGLGIAISPTGGVYFTGGFSGSTDFNPGVLPGQIYGLTPVPISNFDIFVCKLKQSFSAVLGLFSITGFREGNHVSLQWVVPNFTEGQFFSVEGSKNGTDFARVGRLDILQRGSENSGYVFHLALEDSYVRFFRVVLVDVDGNEVVSDVIELSPATPSVTLYPNPTLDGTFTIYADDEFSNAKIEVFDCGGKLVHQDIMPSTFSYHMDRELTQGMYLLNLTSAAGKRRAFRLLIK